MGYVFRLNKETFKFSCTHFTIFGPNSGEKMHGHNYYVSFDLYFNQINSDQGLAVDFNLLKPIIKQVCETLDEHILIAENSPHQKVSKKDQQVIVEFNGKHYSLPQQDTLILPLVNISSEELARYLAGLFIQSAPTDVGLVRVETTIEETRGQAVTFIQDL